MAVTVTLRTLATVVTLVATLGACDNDSVGPEDSAADLIALEEVIGSYSAVTMTTTSAGATTDQLAQGATLELTLGADGATAGRLFVPDGSEDGGDLDADLAGTFSFDENTDEVSFEQSADTFVRDM